MHVDSVIPSLLAHTQAAMLLLFTQLFIHPRHVYCGRGNIVAEGVLCFDYQFRSGHAMALSVQTSYYNTLTPERAI